ncbi:hypothetical protein C8Q75DRAFT_395588 [Abortiporus biennis]|nr:hypothetical protein C8Q75DRAFT_395588 [Abortiporus biennis]
MHARDSPLERANHMKRVHKRQAPQGFTVERSTVTRTFALPLTTLTQEVVVPVTVAISSTTPATPTTSSTPVTTPAQTASTTATSTSSSPATSSTPTPSTTSTSSSSTLSTTPTTQAAAQTTSASPTVPPTTSHLSTSLVSTSTPSASPSSASDLSNKTSSGASKGLSGGAIGGIVAAVIIVGIAIAVYLIRKSFLRKRAKKRNTWGAGIYPKAEYDEKKSDLPPLPPMSEKPVPPAQYNFAVTPAPGSPPTAASFPLPPPPQASYNNPMPPSPMSSGPLLAPTPTLQPSLASPAVPLTQSSTIGSTEYAFVRCTFHPDLPDELSITTGEMVRVVREFDDGWALCMNQRGDQGVVPLECLDRQRQGTQGGAYIGQGMGDWRMSRRASSLYAASAVQSPGVMMQH